MSVCVAKAMAEGAFATQTKRDVLAQLARCAVGNVLTVEGAAAALGTPSGATAARLRRLSAQGWLAPVQRGVYLVRPLEALGGGDAGVVEDPWVLAKQLFAPSYIGGWSAAEHWGLTEQVFRSTFVVSAAGRRRTHEERLAAEFRVVRVERERVESVREVWRGDVRLRVSDRERTLADGLMHPAWVGGVQHLAEMLRTYREAPRFQPLAILHALEAMRAGAGIKRLGLLAERLWPEEREVAERARTAKSHGITALDPAVKKVGRINTRWGLRVNVDVGDA